MTPTRTSRLVDANNSTIETIITQYVKCDVSENGRHRVTAALRENGLLTHVECECDQEMSDSIVRLGGSSCLQLITHLRDGLSNKVPSYEVRLPGALNGLSNAIEMGGRRRYKRKEYTSAATDKLGKPADILALATKWAVKASNIRNLTVTKLHDTLLLKGGARVVASFDNGAWSVDGRQVLDFASTNASLNHDTKCQLCGTDCKINYHVEKHLERPKHQRLVADAIRRAVAILTPSKRHTTVAQHDDAWVGAWMYAKRSTRTTEGK